MGHWVITAHGHGIHGNGLEGDADALLGEFLRKLKAAGHVLHHATFTTAGAEYPDLSTGPAPETGEQDAAAGSAEPGPAA